VFVAGDATAPAWVPAAVASPTTDYCVVSQSGATQFAYKHGPDGAITTVDSTKLADQQDATIQAALCP
jgi:hypothetical protein